MIVEVENGAFSEVDEQADVLAASVDDDDGWLVICWCLCDAGGSLKDPPEKGAVR